MADESASGFKVAPSVAKGASCQKRGKRPIISVSQ